MTVVSKLMDDAIVKCEKLGVSKQIVSRGVVGVAVAAYLAHISYPHLTKLLKAAKLAPSLSTATSDDDDDDSDFDSDDTDEYATIKSNGNEITCSQTDNDETICGNDKSDIDDDPQQQLQTDGAGDRTLVVPNVKRKRKHSKVIKQQIQQAEKLLAQATQERKQSTKGGPLSFSQLEEQRIGLNLEFLMKLKRLVEIMIPKLWCREIGILGVHTACLISRTFLSIYVAAIEGAIVKYIVRKDLRQFTIGLLKWFGIAIPATFINSMIRYLENKLALSFRYVPLVQ